MSRYQMLVFSRPVEGQEAEYNEWYDNQHLPQVLDLPGFVSAQRFHLSRQVGEGPDEGTLQPYLAIYTIETDNIDGALQSLMDKAGGVDLLVSTALDTHTVQAMVYEEFGSMVRL
jgi:hypothetical protein